MIWPFKWRKPQARIEEAKEAVVEAKKQLRQVESRDPEVLAISVALRQIRSENHFAEKLRIIMEGGKHA